MEELARTLGVSSSSIQDIEMGDRRLTIGWVDRLAVAFLLTPSGMLKELDDRTPTERPKTASAVPPRPAASPW